MRLSQRWHVALCFRVSFFIVTVSMWTLAVDVLLKEHGTSRRNIGVNIHRATSFEADETSSSGLSRKTNRTLVIVETVTQTGTTSIRDHVLKFSKACFHGTNGFSNNTEYKISTLKRCPCDTEVLISHLSRFPSYITHVLGHCDLSAVRVVSVIPVREGRIYLELNYGQLILGLDPQKSVLDNIFGYKFTPYVDYSSNPFANTTCLFDFIAGVLRAPRSNPTKMTPFKCETKECEDSVRYIVSQEAQQLKLLRQTFPVCSQSQLAPLHLFAKKQVASEQQHDRYHDGVRFIYTAGQPRTGSTFQYVLLCVLAHLRSDSVNCGGNPNATLSVVKMHSSPRTLHLDSSTMLFTTERDAGWISANVLWTGKNVTYSQQYNKFVQCPLCEVQAYQPIFQLSDEEVLQVTQYMRYWSILRQCCGSQLSKFYMPEILGCAELDYHTEGKIGYHNCGAMNLTAVEYRLLRTHLYSIVPAEKLAGPDLLKFVWAKQGDCTRSHGAIRSGIGFNLAKLNRTKVCATLGWVKSRSRSESRPETS